MRNSRQLSETVSSARSYSFMRIVKTSVYKLGPHLSSVRYAVKTTTHYPLTTNH